MAKELTRNGVVGLELTREEVIDLKFKTQALERKASCREVNCDVLDLLADVVVKLNNIEDMITDILESDE
jgi:hypothetical protein